MGGSFATGFFSSVGSALKEKADQHRANDQKMKDAQAQIYWDGIKSGNLSPEQLEYAQSQLQKIYGNSKPLKEMFKKFGHVVGLIHGKQGGQEQAPQGGTGGMTPPPKMSQSGGPPGAVPIPLGKPGEVKPEPIPLAKPGEGPPPTPLNSAAAQNPQEIPKPSQMSKPPSFADVVAAGHPSDAAQDERAMKFWKEQQKTLHEFKMAEVDAAAKAKAANPSGRPVMGPAVSVSNARTLAKEGRTFQDKDGNPIDLTSLPDTMGLKNIVWGGKSYYEPFSPNSKVVTVGNETYAVSPMDVEALTKGAGTDLGEHRVGTNRDTVKGIDPTSGADVTRSSSQPATAGVKKDASAQGGGATPKPRMAAPPKSSDLLPSNATSQRIAPVREAYTQLFGDPTQPNASSLKDFAYIADNPQASKRVGTAVKFVIDGLEQEEKRSGSLATLLKNYGGIPQSLLQSQMAINKDIIGKLSPEETRAFNSIISSLSTVMGLRSLTKASAAKFSVAALERDVPVPGVNSMNSAAFKDKMARLAEEVYTGSRTVPLPQSERDYIKKQVDDFSSKTPTRMTPPPKAGDKQSIDDIILNEAKKRKPAA